MTPPLDTAVPAPGPSGPGPNKRLVGVDATRGIALLGMIAVHALYDTQESGAPALAYSIAGGRSAATFALLAGTGIAFMTGRRRVRAGPAGRDAIVVLATRAVLIGVLGLALGYTSSEVSSVILAYYAVLFLLAIPLVFLPGWALLAVAGVVAAGAPVLSQWIRPGLPAPVLENPSFSALAQDPVGLSIELAVTGYYPALVYAAYVCVGIAVGRMNLAAVSVAIRLLIAGAALAVAASGVSWWLLVPMGGYQQIAAHLTPEELASAPTVADVVALYPEGTTPTTTWWWLAADAAHSGTPLDLLHTIGSGVALFGAMLLLAHVSSPRLVRLVGVVQRPLAAAGGMTLTLYTAHVVFMNTPLDDFEAGTGYLVQCVAAVLFALAWRRAVGRGPIEATMTSLAGWARDVSRRRAERVAGIGVT